MKKIIYNNILFILLFTASMFAQSFNATVDKTTVGQNERFQVYFKMDGVNVNQVQNFRGPAFRNFIILGGPNQSSSLQIINGQMSGSISYSYIIQPKAVGTFTIGTAQLEYDGKQYQTIPIKIKVVKGTASSNTNRRSNSNTTTNNDIAKNVFIRAFADKRSAYKGEQITVTYKLYTRLNISSPQISKLPSYQGFWAEELATSNTINLRAEMYNGKRYSSAVIKKVALFPTKSGKLKITPFELTIPVHIRKRRRTGNGFFDDFFNDSFFAQAETVNYKAKSNSVTINVRPLPEVGKPKSFSGAVGDFNISASIDKNKVKTNESVTLDVSVSGTGNIKLVDIPEIKLPSGFEKYEPKTSENISRQRVIRGTKKIEYLFVPRIPGKKTIPAIEFSYFNPEKGKYITKRTQPFKIDVAQGKSTETASAIGYSKEDIKLLSEDIRFIKTSNFGLERKSKLTTIPSWFWEAIFLPLFILIIAVGFKKRQDKLSGNVVLMRSRKAEKAAKLKLKSAKKALDAKNITEFYEELSNALFGYLEDKLILQKSEFSHERVLEELSNRNISAELVDKVKAVADKCEFARFAPKGEEEQTAHNLYDETVKLIVNLENSIGKKN